MTRLLAPIAFAAALAAATLTSNPRAAYAYDGVSLAGASMDDGAPTICGQGRTIECGSTTVYKCTEWVYQLTFSPSGFGYTMVCATSVTQVSKSYKD
jgi:hypothetical protein